MLLVHILTRIFSGTMSAGGSTSSPLSTCQDTGKGRQSRVSNTACRFVVDKVALGYVFSEYFGFPCQSLSTNLLHNHHCLSSGDGRSTKWGLTTAAAACNFVETLSPASAFVLRNFFWHQNLFIHLGELGSNLLGNMLQSMIQASKMNQIRAKRFQHLCRSI
jgi:hypothetical protein